MSASVSRMGGPVTERASHETSHMTFTASDEGRESVSALTRETGFALLAIDAASAPILALTCW